MINQTLVIERNRSLFNTIHYISHHNLFVLPELDYRASMRRGVFPFVKIRYREKQLEEARHVCCRLPDATNSTPHTFTQHIHEDTMKLKCFTGSLWGNPLTVMQSFDFLCHPAQSVKQKIELHFILDVFLLMYHNTFGLLMDASVVHTISRQMSVCGD